MKKTARNAPFSFAGLADVLFEDGLQR